MSFSWSARVYKVPNGHTCGSLVTSMYSLYVSRFDLLVFRWRWSFWSRQEEWPSADNGSSPAAGQGISADCRGCRPTGQPQHSCCALCSGWSSTSTVQQCLLHHLYTREHPCGTAVSIQNTQELKFHKSTSKCICLLPLADIFMALQRWTHYTGACAFPAGCGSASMSLTSTHWFSSTKYATSSVKYFLYRL